MVNFMVQISAALWLHFPLQEYKWEQWKFLFYEPGRYMIKANLFKALYIRTSYCAYGKIFVCLEGKKTCTGNQHLCISFSSGINRIGFNFPSTKFIALSNCSLELYGNRRSSIYKTTNKVLAWVITGLRTLWRAIELTSWKNYIESNS